MEKVVNVHSPHNDRVVMKRDSKHSVLQLVVH